MSDKTKLIIIKSLHTAIWALMAAASFYILFAGFCRTTSIWLWISIGLLIAETVVLAANKWVCPLTPLAMRYTGKRQANFDIYLPLLLAKYNKQIFGTIFAIGLLLTAFNALIN